MSIGEGQTLYVLIHLGNINNSEREYRGREKKCVGNIRKGDRTLKTANSGKRTGGGGRGGGRGVRVSGTEQIKIWWQIEHQ